MDDLVYLLGILSIPNPMVTDAWEVLWRSSTYFCGLPNSLLYKSTKQLFRKVFDMHICIGIFIF